MSNYTKQNFVSGQVLNAEHLNHIEDGIAALEQDTQNHIGNAATKEALNQEISRAKKAEEENASDLLTETTRAQKTEKKLSDELGSEIDRAESAERENASAISDERTRASREENRLNDAIDSEAKRAVDAESALDSRVQELNDSLQALGLVVEGGKLCVRYAAAQTAAKEGAGDA